MYVVFVPRASFRGCNSIDSAEVTPDLHCCKPLDDEVPLHLAIIVETVVLVNLFCPLPLSPCEAGCLQKVRGLASLVATGLLLGTKFCPGCEQQLRTLCIGTST